MMVIFLTVHVVAFRAITSLPVYEVEEAEGSEESPSEESGQEEDDRPYREKRMQQWFDRLQADLGIKVIDEANFQ